MIEAKCILVVEDNDKNLRLLKDFLESQGYAVQAAKSGRECLELAPACNPGLILMDIQMPDIDGITVTNLLKKEEATAQIPVVAITALVMKGDKERILKSGFDGYLEKPVNFDLLLEIIQKWL
ncbi:response regulator [Desulfotruncus alcoholivorax]|uniref:response regulator n=1 Tax=Desulfotruncus alcoholivorax TaxID=265477 RepID=UPI0004140968|nr:response regulator [Desulfotruncus alcoholivorax]